MNARLRQLTAIVGRAAHYTSEADIALNHGTLPAFSKFGQRWLVMNN